MRLLQQPRQQRSCGDAGHSQPSPAPPPGQPPPRSRSGTPAARQAAGGGCGSTAWASRRLQLRTLLWTSLHGTRITAQPTQHPPTHLRHYITKLSATVLVNPRRVCGASRVGGWVAVRVGLRRQWEARPAIPARRTAPQPSTKSYRRGGASLHGWAGQKQRLLSEAKVQERQGRRRRRAARPRGGGTH